MVSTDDESLAVSRRAMKLAREGREDSEAVEELRRLSKGRKRSLQRAEQASRLGGRHLEAAEANRAHRLVVAALKQADVEPPDSAQRALFEVLDDFYAAGRPERETWDALLLGEPRLARLLAEVREGRFGPAHQFDGDQSAERFRDPELQRRQGESARGALELISEVKALCGPSRSSVDPVITARRTRDFVNWYLQREGPA